MNRTWTAVLSNKSVSAIASESIDAVNTYSAIQAWIWFAIINILKGMKNDWRMQRHSYCSYEKVIIKEILVCGYS